MSDPGICAVILAAGEGTRLRPLTDTLPKALCPVGNVALLDLALDRVARLGLRGPERVAVNACHLADQIVTHVGARAHISVEPGPLAWNTAGALANLRAWIGGRAVLVGNADAYLAPAAGPDCEDLAPLLADWSCGTVRLLTVPADEGHPAEFSGVRFAGFSLLPGTDVARLPLERRTLVGSVWRPAEAEGRLERVGYDGCYLDTGTVADYLAANLHTAAGGNLIAPGAWITAPVTDSVVGAGAQVHGPITRSVVLPGGRVDRDEHLIDAVRVGDHTTATGGLSLSL